MRTLFGTATRRSRRVRNGTLPRSVAFAPVPCEVLVRDYVLLGLRLDRLVPGTVDTYTGDEALRAHVDAGPAPEPATLLRTARRLRTALPDAGLAVHRQRYLAAQLAAVEVLARRLAGQATGFVDEVEAAFDVRIGPGDMDRYREAHRELETVLPGRGRLDERLSGYRSNDEVEPSRLLSAVRALSAALRGAAAAHYPLPAGEDVGYELVTGRPWSALNRYRRGYRSIVAINVDARPRAAQLAHLIAHEAYPGHHTEHCRKEHGLVVRRGNIEHTISLLGTPQALMAEGTADLGLRALVGAGWGRWAADILRAEDVHLDGALAERVHAAFDALHRARQDAALLLHDRAAGEEAALAHLRRWLLVGETRARQLLGFIAHPLWRTHTTAYVEGVALLAPWLDGSGPAGRVGRYRRLLDEGLVPSVIRAEQAVRLSGCAAGSPVAAGADRAERDRMGSERAGGDRRCSSDDKR